MAFTQPSEHFEPSGKSHIILLQCVSHPQRFSELARTIKISESGLAKNLDTLEKKGLLVKTEIGYSVTDVGQEVAKRLRREDEAKRLKLARKLLALQNFISPKELVFFENVRALIGQRLRSLHTYEALVIASAVELSYSTNGEKQLPPNEEAAIYEKALDFIRKMRESSGGDVQLAIRFNLEEGYQSMLQILRADIANASSEDERRRLEKIRQQLFERKEEALADAVARFLR